MKTNDPMLDYFLYRWKGEIFADLTNYPEHIRALETFPRDQIMDFIDLLNSNIAIALLYKYNTKLLDIVIKEIGAEKLKVDLKELKPEKTKKPNKKKSL